MTDEYIRRVEAEEAIEEYCCRRCKEYSEVEGGCVSHAQHCEHLSGEEILKPVKSADVQPVKQEIIDLLDECRETIFGATYTSGEEYTHAITLCDKISAVIGEVEQCQ